jgi:16S rRNA (guanine(966)-N(2))-methyltransferase RsmD
LKITGGDMRGRRLPKKGLGESSGHGPLRATSSKVRESLFNIIGPGIKGAVFVDLYSGSGAVGTEAMSRGASKVYFVESDPRRASAIEELLKGCGCRQRAVVVREDALGFIRRSREEGSAFDIVFLDPPYQSDELSRVLPVLGEGGVLSEGAVVIAEHTKKSVLPKKAGLLVMHKAYRYGDTSLALYRRAS